MGMGHLCFDISVLNGWDIYNLNGRGIYDSNGWDSYGKVSYCFWEIPVCSKMLVFRGVPFTGFGPFKLQPVAYCRKGGTTPREEPTSRLAFTEL